MADDPHWQQFSVALGARHPQWDGQSTANWSTGERVAAVRALVQDYLHRANGSWWRAGDEAEVHLAQFYHDWSTQTGRQDPWEVPLGQASDGEMFSLLVRVPQDSQAVPNPMPLGGARRGVALVRAAPSGGLALSEAAVDQAVRAFETFMGLPNRLALIVVATAWVRWHALCEQQVVRAGVRWYGMVNPSRPDVTPQDIKILSGRFGPAMEAALERCPEGGAFYLP